MSRVLVIGGSGQGRQVIDAFTTVDAHEVVGVLDGNLAVGAAVGDSLVVGSAGDLARCAADTHADGFIVAIGDNFTRGALLERALTDCPDLAPISVVHAAAVVARDAVVGGGSILLAGSVVGNAGTVGRGVLLGTSSSIDHDCVLGDFVSLAPGAHTGGDVRVGQSTAIGVGASIIHGVEIGEHTVIGAGSVVLADVAAYRVAYGVPARVARPREAGERYL